MCLLLEAGSCLWQRVAEVVVGQGAQDHSEWIRLVMKRSRARRERALASAATPKLYDLKLLSADASARQHVAAAVRAGLWRLGRMRDVRDAGKRSGLVGVRFASGRWAYGSCADDYRLRVSRLTKIGRVVHGFPARCASRIVSVAPRLRGLLARF